MAALLLQRRSGLHSPAPEPVGRLQYSSFSLERYQQSYWQYFAGERAAQPAAEPVGRTVPGGHARGRVLRPGQEPGAHDRGHSRPGVLLFLPIPSAGMKF